MEFVEFLGTPEKPTECLQGYVNRFLYFHSRGFSLSRTLLDIIFSGEESYIRSEQGSLESKEGARLEDIELKGASMSEQALSHALTNISLNSKEFYLSLGECDTDLLILTLLHHFPNFKEMNEALGKGRLVPALAQHVAEEQKS